MMRTISRWTRWPVVLAAAGSMILLSLALPGETTQPTTTNDCSFSVEHHPAPELQWRELSRHAELFARTMPSRRRPIANPRPSIPHQNFIDDEIFGAMTRDGIEPTRLTTDEEFLRRVSLDLTGTIPSPELVTQFLASKDPDKRAIVIDLLLEYDAFVDRWTMWFGDHVQNVQFATNFNIGYEARNAYHEWIRDSIARNEPYDAMVRALITSTGDNWVRGESNYVIRQLQPNGPPQDSYDNLSAHTGSKFLGLPLECISCHNGLGHLELVNGYLATRKRHDFWANAAFFATIYPQIDRLALQNQQRRFNLSELPNREYLLDTDDGNKTPRSPLPGEDVAVEPAFFLGGEGPYPGEPRREAYARILTGHRQFARATVNYIWQEMFHLGIVEPADSFDLNRLDPDDLKNGATLQPSHPELLEKLADHFIDSGYDLRELLRLMASSSTYQLATEYTPGEWDEAWTPYFARRLPRRLSAEMLFDAITSATSVPVAIRVRGMFGVRRAMQLPDPIEPGPRSPVTTFLDAFGRGDRDDEARTWDGSILQALEMMNDPLVTERIKRSTRGSTVQQVLESTDHPAAIVDALYLRTLSRLPSRTEREDAISWIEHGDPATAVEDLQFALLNSIEFLFN